LIGIGNAIITILAIIKVTRGRGENVKLLLEDAGLEHDYVRLKLDQKWYDLKDKLTAEGHHSVTLPYIQVKDKYYFKTHAILRYLSVKLGSKYHGSTPEENQLVDVVCEVADLWFNSLRISYWGTDVSS
jgi:glutaredoxin